MPLTRIRQTAIGNDSITTAKLDDTSGGLTLPGVEYVHVPVGTTAQRPSSPENGHLRYNTNFERLEQYADGQWQSIDTPPSITSLSYSGSLTAADPAGGETITLAGSNFQAGATVTVGGTSATSVSVVGSTSITFTTPAKTAGDYDVTVTNSNGLAATLLNGISYNGVPSFTTAAGNVGSIAEDIAMSTITIVAAEPDGGTLAFSVTSGALPTGVSMSSAGAITGTPNVNPTSNTTFNFTVTATDDENQTNSRAFNLIVLRPIYATSIDNSLRFNDNDSEWLNWTPSATGNQKTWTMSMWVKQTKVSSRRTLFGAYDGSASRQCQIYLGSDDKLYTEQGGSNTSGVINTTNQVFRDTTGWYHFVFVADYANSTVADKFKVYVNGSQISYSDFTITDDYADENGQWNGQWQHGIGATYNSGNVWDGYMADVHFIDGQTLTPTSFGEEFNGVWVPKAYSGTYGTNGFKLDFSDGSDLGKDSSQDYTLVTTGSTTYGGGTTNFTNPDDAFDGLTSTGMNRSGTTGIIEITPSSAVTPIYHEITNTNSAAYTDASRPQNVQLEGSNDGGSTWTVIDTITQTPTGAESTTSSSFSNSTSYTKLRLNITTNNGGTNTRFSEYKVISSEAGGGVSINNFTTNGFASRDSTPDSPTNNFAILNEAAPQFGNVSNGNLSWSASVAESSMSTIGMSSGKWYWEWRVTSNNNYFYLVNDSNSRGSSTGTNTVFGIGGTGTVSSPNATTVSDTLSTTSGGDIMACRLDVDNKVAEIYQNNTKVVEINQFTLDGPFFAAFDRSSSSNTGVTHTVNFGQDSTFDGYESVASNADENGIGEFAYAVPSGYLALCAKNLSESAINTSTDDRPEDYFDAIEYTGNATARTITDLTFQPDLLWIKVRGSGSHYIVDSVRGSGTGDSLNPFDITTGNPTSYENLSSHVTALTSNGFSLGNNSDTTFYVNRNSELYSAWAWKAGGAPTATNSAGAGAVPTAGSVKVNGSDRTTAFTGITSPTKQSVNTKTGFSITQYVGNATGSGAANSVDHGLNEAPEMIWIKELDGADSIQVYSKYIDDDNSYFLQLVNTDAQKTTSQDMWNELSPTNSVFHLGYEFSVNENNKNYIAYSWHSVPGFSKFGKYTGNNSADGSYIHLGFKPAFFMLKEYASGGTNLDWHIFDNTMDVEGQNPITISQRANKALGDVTGRSQLDFLANGVKHRESYGDANSGEYIYMAFAEDPFKYSEAR